MSTAREEFTISPATLHLMKFDMPISALELSWSQISTMSTCDFKWYLDYIMKYRKYTFAGEAAERGRIIHKILERGFNDMTLSHEQDGTEVVDLFSSFEQEIPDEYIEALYWVEDYMQKWWLREKKKGRTFDDIKPRMEYEIRGKPQPIMNMWYQRYGWVDMVWKLDDGSYFLWDFKTGKCSEYSIRSGLRQLYYYKSMFESWGMKVSGFALMYPFAERIIQRVNRAVTRGSKDISKFSTVSMQSVEKLINTNLHKLLTSPVLARYNEWYCIEYCPYNDPDLLVCNLEPQQDLLLLPMVSSREELLEAFE